MAIVGTAHTATETIDAIRSNKWNFYQRHLQQEKTINQIAAKQEFDKAAQQSKLAKRDAEAFGEFVQEVGQANGIDEFYIDAEALQQSGIADALVQNSPSVAEQYQQALDSGGSVFVPLSEYASRVATEPELASRLDEIVRTEPDGNTLAEIKTFNAAEQLQQDIDQQAQEAIEQANTAIQSDEVYNHIYGQLKQLGRFSDDVSQQ